MIDQIKFPLEPNFPPLVGNDQRAAVFGKFRYRPAPTPDNKEAIQILDGWEVSHIIKVYVPQLIGIPGGPKSGFVRFHKKGATQLQAMFKEWEQAGLLNLILKWGGSYVPRFVRGSQTQLSNHAFGSAFDVNAFWNPLGKATAGPDRRGCVWPLVPIANKHGFYWGGHYKQRPDGMHFELARILPKTP